MTMPQLTPDTAERLAGITLGHVTRQFPHKVDHVMEHAGDVYTPRAMHPIFYGSYDWHSCVHGYWLLARLRRLQPMLPQARAISKLFDLHFTPDKASTEAAYLARPSANAFERPYGWAWLLMLSAELHRDGSEAAQRWQVALNSLTGAVVQRFHAYLPKLTYPIRAGVHSNTAFALALAAEYASARGDHDLRLLLNARAVAWFEADRNAPAWEPGGDDFLSPTLMEAEAMRRLLPADRFARWFDDFLPSLAHSQPASLFAPAQVSDRRDGKIAHLDGLNLRRAWCWRALAASVGTNDDRHAVMLRTSEVHFRAAVDVLTADYMGEHWLATFALLTLTA